MRAIALIVLSLPLLVITYVVAVALSSVSGQGHNDIYYVGIDSVSALLRSLAAGIISSIAVVMVGLGAAWLLSRSSLSGYAGYRTPLALLLPLAIVPLFSGSSSFAFLYRDVGTWWLGLLGEESRGTIAVLASEVLAQTLRYAPLLTWLLIIAGGGASERARYARQLGMTGYEWGRVELASRFSPIVFIILVFVFQDASNDHAIVQLSLRPSPATETELLAHALHRHLMSLLTARSALEAMSVILLVSIASACVLVFGFLAMAGAAYEFFRRLKSIPTLQSARRGLPDLKPASGLALVASGLVLVVAVVAVSSLQPSFEIQQLTALGPAAMVSAGAALMSWLLASLCIFGLRDREKASDESILRDLTLATCLAVSVGFIPSAALALSVYGVAYSMNADLAGDGWIWLMTAQALRATPVTFALMLPAALLVNSNELRYLRSIGDGFRGRMLRTFLRPNPIAHGAILLIAFNMILNESIIASLFQTQIPSLADFMRRATTGRSADYGGAGTLVVSMLAVFGVAMTIWGLAVSRQWRRAFDAH